jgi:hypothetical protein
MNFVVGLPRTPRGKDGIWFVVDRLTKSTNFIPMKMTTSAKELVPFYMKEVLRLHGVPKSIVSDWDCKFVSKCLAVFVRILWAQSFLLVLFFNPSVLYKPWRICCMFVCYLGMVVGGSFGLS